MDWKIEFAAGVEKELSQLAPQTTRRIMRFLYERIAPLDNLRSIGEALRGPQLGNFWKYRLGAYRVVTSIEDDQLVVLVVRVGHRRHVYR